MVQCCVIDGRHSRLIDFGLLVFLGSLICLSAFFAGAETALVSTSVIKAQMFAEQKRPGSASLYRLKNKPNHMITTILLGNNLVNIVATALATEFAITEFGSFGIGIATGVMTFLILTFGEITPKSYFNLHSDRMALLAARPVEIFSIMILPLVWFFENLSRIILKGLKTDFKPSSMSSDELEAIVETASQQKVIPENVGEMIKGALDFKETSAREVMTPRLKMFVLDANLSVEEALKELSCSQYSRAPIVGRSKDEIIGVVHIKDLLSDIENGKGAIAVSNVAKKPVFVSREERLPNLLKEMQHLRVHMAVVVDEFGGVEGLLTMEDLLEEITGEILDESDLSSNLFIRLDKNTVVTHGDTEINHLEQFLNIELPREGDYSTINGMLHNMMRDIPKEGDKIELDQATLVVEQVKDNISTRIRVIKKPESLR